MADRTEYLRNYYKNNKKKYKKYSKKYYQENATIIKAKSNQYYKDNKEARTEYHRDYIKNNRESINENNRRYLKKLKGKNTPLKPNALKLYHKLIEELNDVCSLYWVVRKYAAVTRFQNRRKRYKQLRKDFEEIQRMKKAA